MLSILHGLILMLRSGRLADLRHLLYGDLRIAPCAAGRQLCTLVLSVPAAVAVKGGQVRSVVRFLVAVVFFGMFIMIGVMCATALFTLQQLGG